ncbi:hypothetical protein AAE02nite_24010 [Adhaeribacter aerolatus]|uniref:DUF2147 domain-containing protein n=1 Tax=Adhaeribacter aerolatus TaxID=670289 RepID=A0A512AYZ4_9BACT|nr:DUF2147 domain-containing protein [Adhaeribacter aerolatus]GEO04737.1 hypothetical protein AAE02nite_24010 [Adhaeribacter aerolatus]
MKLIANIFLSLLLLVSNISQAQKATQLPLGTWTNEDKEARFQIYKCGEKLCGKISWLKEPMLNGKPKVDSKNPDEKLRGQPILGMVFLKDFSYTGNNKWDNGSIYDPKSGKIYACYLKILDENKMEVKGYIGISLIGRSQIWTRIK